MPHLSLQIQQWKCNFLTYSVKCKVWKYFVSLQILWWCPPIHHLFLFEVTNSNASCIFYIGPHLNWNIDIQNKNNLLWIWIWVQYIFLWGWRRGGGDRGLVMTLHNQDGGNICNGIQCNTSRIQKVIICELGCQAWFWSRTQCHYHRTPCSWCPVNAD